MAGRKVKDPVHKKKKTVSMFQIYKAEVERLLAKTQTGGGWYISFNRMKCKPMRSGAIRFADVEIDCSHRFATFRLNISKETKMTRKDALSCARHEFGHFVAGRLSWLASCRYLNEEDITEEGEAIAMVFQKLC